MTVIDAAEHMPERHGATGDILELSTPAAAESARTGRKAAALARARAAGLPVLPGVVLTVGAAPRALATAVHHLPTPWIVRSSSPSEDGATESAAGRFGTVRDVAGIDELPPAVHRVLDSAAGGPMAVLVQTQLEFEVSGVLFGVDPVTGAPEMVVAVTRGSPERLVSGEEDGDLLHLTAAGGLRRDGRRVRDLPRGLGPELAALAARAAALFGGPQDVEWGLSRGALVLLQSRPVTRVAATVARGAPALGAGPLAETFPEPLWPLEEDLWLPPLDAGLVAALRRTGGRPGNEPVVRSVGGHAVARLAALGAEPTGRTRSLTRALDPRPGIRRLRVSWRVGRLRATLPGTAGELLTRVDALLAEVPPAPELSTARLVAVLDRTTPVLSTVHEHEALMGLVLGTDAPAVTGVGLALRVWARDGRPAAEVVRDEPVLLALTPPSIAPPSWPATAPPEPDDAPAPPAGDPTAADPAVLREALRLRARWIQELQAASARELGLRLRDAGRLPDALAVRRLRLDELLGLLRDPARTWDEAAPRRPATVPLPDVFRLATDGTVVADRPTGPGGAGVGAAPGRAVGIVVHDPAALAELPPGRGILVVRVLSPALAVHLPNLGGLLAQTGSPLSHLAILAREHGVPAVVGLPDARVRFVPGTRILIDGRAGTVTALPAASAAPDVATAAAPGSAPASSEVAA